MKARCFSMLSMAGLKARFLEEAETHGVYPFGRGRAFLVALVRRINTQEGVG
jgi:hypothetical protein